GVEGETDAWLRDPIQRVLVFALSATPSLCLERLRAIAADGARSVALVFDLRARARHFGLGDFVAPPPIDLAEYAETSTRERRPATSKLRVATVGQDGRRVVVAPDLDLLRAVASQAAELVLFDPGPLRYEVGTTPTIRCVARDEWSFADLVSQADLYLHRTGPWWAEDFGRALFGAMALGVPVLCPRDSMHAEYIDDGVDGWIYDDPPTASAILDALSRDPSRIAHAGRLARTKALRLFDARALTDAYLSVVRRWRAAA
ncbi:MAG TPA: glycosyltransferase, partial [Casimicrobiaceae bacterium]|nr:glycosyltransferase [Casimicrobiaceae bacterium]